MKITFIITDLLSGFFKKYKALIKSSACAVLILLVANTTTAATTPVETFDQQLYSQVDRVLDFASRQLTRTAQELEIQTPLRYPRSTLSDGTWATRSETDWTSGFFPGLLWLMYEYTDETQWREWAELWTQNLAGQALRTDTHDIGFEVLLSYGHGFRLTGRADYEATVLTAANSLASRFNESVGATRSWDWGVWSFPVIVDNLMNLELLYWGAKNAGGDEAWKELALRHSLTSIAEHMRVNGSSFHVVDFDPVTGQTLSKTTWQGLNDNSTWARGQAWMVYGLTMSARESRDKRVLGAAQTAADFYINNLPDDFVPYWDFDAATISGAERDSSAAAIAASGLLELSHLTCNPRDKFKYLQAGIKTLISLSSPAYLADKDSSHGILLHGVGGRPFNGEVDVTLIYGDYYFIEALMRVRRSLDLIFNN